VITTRGYQPEDCKNISRYLNEIIKVAKSLKGKKLDFNDYTYETKIIQDLKREVY